MFSNYCFTRAIKQLILPPTSPPPQTNTKRMFQIKIDLIIAHFTIIE